MSFEFYACRDLPESQYFNGGYGTPSSPFLVCSAAQLNRVRYFPSAYFLQVKDIDLSASANGQPANWFAPIEGSSVTPADKSTIITTASDPSSYDFFSGSYNGGGFRIKNFSYTPTGDSALLINGLFSVNEGTIYNVILDSANINGNVQSGALVGINIGSIYGVSVLNSNVIYQPLAVSIANDDQGLGVIAGANLGVITDSSVSNSVITGGLAIYVGAICGILADRFGAFLAQIYSSTVTNTNIYGFSDVGGAVGFVGAFGSELIDSVTISGSSIVSDTTTAGGIVGTLSKVLNNANIDNSTVMALTNYAGGLVGFSGSGSNVSSVDVDSVTVLGTSYVGGGIGGGTGTHNGVSVSYATISGSGTGTGGYIGYETASSNFTTITVANTNIYTTASESGGFVGTSRGDSNYTNVQVNSGVVSGGVASDRIGGFFGTRGTTGGGSLSNCDVSQTDVSGQNYVGGFIGYNNFPSAIIDASVMGGTVTATGVKAGGFAGYNDGWISSSFVNGTTITGTYAVGGFVGYVIGLSGQEITQSYATDIYLTASDTGGGFVGLMIGSAGNIATISRSYVYNPRIMLTHTAGAYNTQAGGFAGMVYNFSSITRSYVTSDDSSSYYIDGNGTSGSGITNVSGFVGNSSSANTTLSDNYVSDLSLSGTQGASTVLINGFSGDAFKGTESKIYTANLIIAPSGGATGCLYSCTTRDATSSSADTYYLGAGDTSGRATAKSLADFTTAPNLNNINSGGFNSSIWNNPDGTSFPTLVP